MNLDGNPDQFPGLVEEISGLLAQRRDVFVLGAGFSMAVAPVTMPSTVELGRRVVETACAFHSAAINGVHSSRCDGLSCDWPQLIDGEPPASFEVWLGQLAEAIPYRSDADNARSRSLFLDLLDITEMEIRSSTLDALRSSPWSTSWLVELVRAWHETRASVLTFNYDTLVESAIFQADLTWRNDPPPNRLSYRGVGPTIVPAWRPMIEGNRLPPSDSFQFFKLHGSINWYWDESTRSSDSIVEIGLPETWDETSSDNRRFRSRGLAPLLVPPLTSKGTYLASPTLRELWRLAFSALTNARRIVLIGYSLPEYDLLVTSMLRDAAHLRDIPVTIVDVDDAVAARVRRLGFENIDTSFIGVDAVARFTHDYVAEGQGDHGARQPSDA